MFEIKNDLLKCIRKMNSFISIKIISKVFKDYGPIIQNQWMAKNSKFWISRSLNWSRHWLHNDFLWCEFTLEHFWMHVKSKSNVQDTHCILLSMEVHRRFRWCILVKQSKWFPGSQIMDLSNVCWHTS